MLNRKAIVWVAAALILAGVSIWSGPSAANAGSTSWTMEGPGWGKESAENHFRGEMTGKEFEAYRLERMKEMASYFGISTEGKSAEQLKQELMVAKEANAEKWEAFKAEHRAKRLDHLKEMAKEQGLQTEGKSAEQLHKELRSLHGNKGPKRIKDSRKESVKEETAKPTPEVKPQQTPAVPKLEQQAEPKAAPKLEQQAEPKAAPKSGATK